MKRFYREANSVPAEGGFGVALDGKPLRTPAKRPMIVPRAALADAIAAEWAAQDETIIPDAMGLTRLANTAIDRVADQFDAVLAETAKYAETDMLCYRAAQPQALAALQAQRWQGLLDWASLRFDAPLAVATGILPIAQPPESLLALARALKRMDAFLLTATADLTGLCGSLVLALAVVEARVSADEAVQLALLDELYQAEHWGADREAVQRRARIERDIHICARFAACLAA
jgi:chaperone required for assembly of F1-ATPase